MSTMIEHEKKAKKLCRNIIFLFAYNFQTDTNLIQKYLKIRPEPVVEEKPKKGMRSEVTERWGHDMFDESQQGPKSEQELLSLYGYDIRKEEGAPRYFHVFCLFCTS